MSDQIPEIHRRALSDYQIALGLELQSRRTNANLSFGKLATRCDVPAETLRSYERGGAALPQLARLAKISDAYGVALLEILESTAEYIYRASGEPPTGQTGESADRRALRALILYCGVTPAQLPTIEAGILGELNRYD